VASTTTKGTSSYTTRVDANDVRRPVRPGASIQTAHVHRADRVVHASSPAARLPSKPPLEHGESHTVRSSCQDRGDAPRSKAGQNGDTQGTDCRNPQVGSRNLLPFAVGGELRLEVYVATPFRARSRPRPAWRVEIGASQANLSAAGRHGALPSARMSPGLPVSLDVMQQLYDLRKHAGRLHRSGALPRHTE